MAAASLQQEQLIVTRPDDWHLHLRDGGVLCQHRPCSSSGNGD
jgi:dihydroorotase